MKRNTVAGYVLLALGITFSAAAQTPEQRAEIVKNYDHAKIRAMEAEFAEKSKMEKAEALRLAEIHGWPVVIKEEDGTFMELKKVKDGKPAYVKTYNRGAAKTARVDKINTGGSAGLNLNGQGMIVGIWDGGRVKNTHLDLVGRVVLKDAAAAFDDHATHVAGTMMGSGQTDPFARGLAYQATLWGNDWNGDISEMIAQAGQGLLVSNHSYGLDAAAMNLYEFGAYTLESHIWDDIIFEAEYYQPVVAAGNDRNNFANYNPTKGGRDLLFEQATSKNVVTVAAVSEVANYTGPNDVIMSIFSNWGPTDDGRVKPDISTKGVAVYSTVANPGNASHAENNGTSMAAPGISATFLLWQQHYNNLNGTFMRSATVRGLMAHTADEAGDFDGPDYKFGWGLINAEAGAAVITADHDSTNSYILETSLAEDQVFTKTFISDGTPFKATIAWTDPVDPQQDNINNGNVDLATPVLTNDLDLRVSINNQQTLPWKLNLFNLDNGAIRADNRVDNIEKIEVAATPAVNQEIVITVSHKSNLQNVGGNQKYTLIVTGIDATLGVDKTTVESSFNIWPNPANDVLNISLKDTAMNNLDVTIYDIQGRQVMRNILSKGTFVDQIDISNLTSGVYIVELSQDGYKASMKLIKK